MLAFIGDNEADIAILPENPDPMKHPALLDAFQTRTVIGCYF